jgi:hypothetical protein
VQLVKAAVVAQLEVCTLNARLAEQSQCTPSAVTGLFAAELLEAQRGLTQAEQTVRPCQ